MQKLKKKIFKKKKQPKKTTKSVDGGWIYFNHGINCPVCGNGNADSLRRDISREFIRCLVCANDTVPSYKFDENCSCNTCANTRRGFGQVRSLTAESLAVLSDGEDGSVPFVSAPKHNEEQLVAYNSDDDGNNYDAAVYDDRVDAQFKATCLQLPGYIGTDNGRGEFQCLNCGNTDYTLVIFDEHQWQFYSKCCGIVSTSDPVPPSCYKSFSSRELGICGVSYDRSTHINEIIRQCLRKEPHIPEHDYQLIKNEIKDLTEIFGLEFKQKSQIQDVLRSLNEQHNTKRFTQKYLEKWRSILYDICGYDSGLMLTQQECAIWSLESTLLSQTFDRLKKENHPKLANRKHIPNLMIMARRIFNKYNITYDPDEFPIPKTESCVKNSNEIINFLWLEAKKNKNKLQ